MARVGKKAGMIAGIAIAALALAAGIALAVYVDNNRHGEERDLARAHAAGFEEKQVQVSIAIAGDATLNYAEGPDNGPALVLVHGQGMQWEDYARVLPNLAKRYHVFAVDCFGHGESSHDPALYSCEAIGQAVKAFAEWFGSAETQAAWGEEFDSYPCNTAAADILYPDGIPAIYTLKNFALTKVDGTDMTYAEYVAEHSSEWTNIMTNLGFYWADASAAVAEPDWANLDWATLTQKAA